MPELIWEGKYDSAGRRATPLRVSLPFQTVETVNESAQERQRSLDFFFDERSPDWRNRLIWGDKKYVLPALQDEFAEQVDLIYIDPPFATGQDFSLPVQVGDSDFTKQPNIIEQKAYRDTWGSGLDTYAEWFASMATYLHELLSPAGSLYVHVDTGVSHMAKLILDEVFGRDNFRNEMVWKRFNFHADAKRFGHVTDRILFYTKSSAYIFNPLRSPFSSEYENAKFTHVDEDGRRYRLSDLNPPGGRGPEYDFHGVTKPWRFSRDRMLQLEAEGRIYTGSRVAQLKRYLDELDGQSVHELWTDISPINPRAEERIDYPTQKPEALLERIINASSREDSLVLDCLAGSGTTAVVAERLKRRWIVSDLGRFAIHTTRKRLLRLPDVRPFVVQNLGKYERQLWQAAEFGESAHQRTAAYRGFILELYHATALAGYPWLHGLKQGRIVHVGTVDAPVTVGDVKQIVAEFRKAVGVGKEAPKEQSADILGWDFAFELNEIARQDAERAGIRLRLVRIPREVLEKRAVEQGDIRFFELAALAVGLEQNGRRATLTIEDFVIPLDDVPADVQNVVTHWSQWIDYWAVDWDNKKDAFHNEWQAYRTGKSRSLALSTEHEYPAPGDYVIVVKVIDILGNDTTKVMSVKVAGSGA
jgi:adenine-specific DNA-methyltransferase